MVLPLVPWYLPAAQLEHVGCFSCALNVPGAQGVAEAEPTEQYVPLPHVTHCDSLVSTSTFGGAAVPAGHGSGADAPSTQ